MNSFLMCLIAMGKKMYHMPEFYVIRQKVEGFLKQI